MVKDFERTYLKFYKEIYQFAFSLSLSTEDSSDLSQEAFIRLLKEYNKGVTIENPRAWLYKVILNLWRNEHNKSKKQKTKNLHINTPLTDHNTPEKNFLKIEKRDLIFDCLNQLSPIERDIVLLYHDGFSYAEIAELLDMRTTSVGTTLSRSIKKLTTKLKAKHHELFD